MELTFKTKPFDHQLKGLKAALWKEAFAYFMEMGTGKSWCAIMDMVALWKAKKIQIAVIIAPKGVYMNWVRRELKKHLPDLDPEPRIVYWKAGPNKREATRMSWFVKRADPGRLRILVVNVEAFSTARGPEYVKKVLDLNGPALIILDESTTIKNVGAKRTKAILKLRARSAYRRILSGNPLTRDVMDLYSQCAFLDPRFLGHNSFYTYRNHFAEVVTQFLGPRSFRTIAVDKKTGEKKFKNLPELSRRLEKFSFRVTKEECLDLPPKLYTIRDVELTKEQVRAYKQMKEECIAELEGSAMVSVTAVITQMLRLHQIVLGRVPSDDGVMIELPCNRMSVLLETTEECDGKAIIWASYVEDIRAISRALAGAYSEESVVTYYGGTTSVQRSESIDRFWEDPACRFFVGNPAVGGQGIDLTPASTVIYYSNRNDADQRKQSEDRPHRIGQTKSVTYVDLLARGTVEEIILKSIRGKLKLSAAVLRDQWREWVI